MSNKIILKKSSVTGKIPVADDLAYGELALNYTDGLLYYKHSNNEIRTFTSRLLVAPINKGDTLPDPGAPSLVWSTAIGGLLLWDGSKWDTATTQKLKTLENLNTFGFVVRDPSTGNFVTRELAGTAGQIQIFNANGEINPSVALVDTGVIPGSYAKVSVDAQGRIRSGGPLTAADIPSDFIQLYNENFTNAAPSSVLGQNAISIGNGNNVPAEAGIAMGEQALVRHKKSFVYAAGRFASQGDAQTGKYILKAVTTNNFQRDMFLDGPMGTTPLIIPDHATWTFRATITAHQTESPDNSEARAGWEIRGVVYKIAGATTIAFQGNPVIEVLGRSNQAWTINTIANKSNGSLSFVVQGESSKIIRWMALVETVEVTN